MQNGIALAGGCAIGDLLMPDDLRYIISIQVAPKTPLANEGTEPYFSTAWVTVLFTQRGEKERKSSEAPFLLS